MLKIYKCTTLILLLLLLLVSCNKSAIEYSTSIVFSASTGGYTEHCGCRIKRGGILERATLLREISRKSENTFIFDGGNSISSIQFPKERLLELYKSMGYEAYFVTAYEFRKLRDFFLKENRGEIIVTLSSFTLLNEKGDRIFKPYLEKVLEGKRTLFVSLTGHTNLPHYYSDINTMNIEDAVTELITLSDEYDEVFLITDYPDLENQLIEKGVKNLTYTIHMDKLHETGLVKESETGTTFLLPPDGKFFWHIGFGQSGKVLNLEEVREGIIKDIQVKKLMEKLK